jgi:hypothetical protein
MSLLADLLSRVKHQGFKRDVPPNLRQVVEDSSERATIKKKVALLSVIVLAAVIAGFGVIYVLNTFIKPSAVKPMVPQPQPALPAGSMIASQSAPPAVQTPAPAPPLSHPEVSAPAPAPPSQHAPAQHSHKHKPVLKKRPVPAPIDGEAAVAETKSGQISKEGSEKKDMYLYAARASESSKDYKEALSNYTKALDFDPGNYFILNNIAGIMLLMGRYNDALLYARNAFNIRADYAPSLINMGIASVKLNNTADGERYLSRALTLDPSNKTSLLNLALLHEKNVEYERAYSSFYKLAELGDVQGYLGLARIAEKNGKTPDAARIYREILSMNNISPKIRKLASERLSLLGDSTR